jgi:hypothetical protein
MILLQCVRVNQWNHLEDRKGFFLNPFVYIQFKVQIFPTLSDSHFDKNKEDKNIFKLSKFCQI